MTSQRRRNDVIKLANQIFEGKRWISICVLWNSEVVKWQGVKWRGAKRRWGVKWRQGVKWRVMRNADENRQKIWFNLQVLIPNGLASLYGVCVVQMLDPILQITNSWYCSKIKTPLRQSSGWNHTDADPDHISSSKSWSAAFQSGSDFFSLKLGWSGPKFGWSGEVLMAFRMTEVGVFQMLSVTTGARC